MMNTNHVAMKRSAVAFIATVAAALLAGCNGDEKQKDDVAAIRKMMEDDKAKKTSEEEADKARFAALRAKASEASRKAGIKR